ncbi:MAG: PASTA domain-containing protein [Planctomycetaceae bacterium]|nr:PASTA domain-containing protein [Planctomycetaceae bacterium]
MPNILGLKENQASSLIKACGLLWSYSPNPQTQSYEAIGTIGDQEPDGGMLVKKGSTVRGFLSKGFFLPSFIGWKGAMAQKWAADLRLGAKIITKRNAAPKGTVFAQKPSNAEFFNSGLPLTLHVSEGLWIKIPKLKGLRYNQAMKLLEKLKLKVVHGNGFFEWGRKSYTICEISIWFPIVSSRTPPASRVFENDVITLNTAKGGDVLFVPPPKGKLCP